MENKKRKKKYIKFSAIVIVSFMLMLIGTIRNVKVVFAVSNDHRPVGNVSVSVKNQTLHLEGYAFDQDCPYTLNSDITKGAVAVHVYIFQDTSNKICIKTCVANDYNIEAPLYHSCGFFHGFNTDVTVDKTGTWNLEVYAIDINSDGSTAGIYNPIIYSGSVTFTKEPSISINTNALTLTSDGTLTPYSVNVDTDNTGNYHVLSDSDWLKVSKNRNKNLSATNLLSVSSGYFYIFADKNTGRNNRTGTITIRHANDSSKKQIITITQTAPESQLTVLPIDVTADSDGTMSPYYISIDTNNTGECFASSNNNWLKISTTNNKNSSVTKLSSVVSGYLYIFAEKNTDTSERIGTLTIGHISDKSKQQIVTVTQKGAVSVPTPTPIPTPTLTAQLTVDPTMITAMSDGILSQSYINIDINNTGNYNVSSNDAWLTVGTSSNKASSKTNVTSIKNKTLYIFASENTSENSRTGTLVITHASDKSKQQKVTVTQSGKKKIVLQVNQSEMSIQADGTISPTHIVKVTTSSTGGFHISSDSNWLKISKENSNRSLATKLDYTDSGNFYLFADENTEENSKNAIITIIHDKDSEKKIEIKVIQEGKKIIDSISSYLSVNQTELSVAANGDFADDNHCISVNTNNTGGFQVSNKAGWIKISKNNTMGTEKTLQYTDSGNVYFFAEENTSEKKREAIVTITHDKDKNLNKAILITQEPLEESSSNVTLSVSRDIVNANVNGETDVNYIEVKTENSNGFSVKTDSAWIHIAKTSDGSKGSNLSFEGNSKFYIFVDKTESNIEREGKIIVSCNSEDISTTIFIRQAELIPVLNASVNTISIEQDGSFSGENKIDIDTEKTGGFTAVIKDASWLRLISNKEDGFLDGFATKLYDDSSSIYLVAKENETGSIRTGQILIEHSNGGKSITITVSQSGAQNITDRAFLVDTQTHDFDRSNRAISSGINITADSEINWTVTSNDSTWLKIAKDNSLSADSYGSISGNGNGTFYIIVEKNETYEERGNWIRVTAPEHESYEIYVTQAKNEIIIPSKPIVNQIKFSTSKKTFGKKKTSKIKIEYPELPELNVEEIDVKNCVEYIKYKSNKPKIVSVNKKGVIKGKKKGKGKISVKIKLSDDMGNHVERTVTVNVKVGRAKVNIKAFQDKD